MKTYTVKQLEGTKKTYPLGIVCHIETKEQHKRLKELRSCISDYSPEYKYYLCKNMGYARDMETYSPKEYLIIEPEQIEGFYEQYTIY